MSPNATFSNSAAGIVPTTAFPESPLSATLVSDLSPVLSTKISGPDNPALPPLVT